ncbi:MAG: dGTP triphosphohydrolase [Brevinema sp.]
MSKMKWSDLLSVTRISNESEELGSDTRSPYERDYLRILYSDHCRRLSDKTQVFTAPHNAVIHNRLTHSLEVSSIGRSLARIISYNLFKRKKISENDELLPKILEQWYIKTYPNICPEKKIDSTAKKILFINSISEVVATTCLAHDLGNTPFGHAGEKAITDTIKIHKEKICAISSELYDDLFNFDGNNYGLRVLLTKRAFNITYASIGAFIKYPICSKDHSQKLFQEIDIYKKVGVFAKDNKEFEKIFTELKITKNNTWGRHPLAFVMEAADDIGYIIMDFEDSVRSKVINVSDPISIDTQTPIMDILYNCLTKDQKNKLKEQFEDIKKIKKNKWIAFSKNPKSRDMMAKIRGYFINNMIHYACDQFINNYDEIMNGTHTVSLLKKNKNKPLSRNFEKLRQFSRENIYTHRSVLLIEGSGYAIISNLLGTFLEAELKEEDARSSQEEHALKILKQECSTYNSTKDNYDCIIAIIGFIAGMTDKYAIELFQRINGHIFHGIE